MCSIKAKYKVREDNTLYEINCRLNITELKHSNFENIVLLKFTSQGLSLPESDND